MPIAGNVITLLTSRTKRQRSCGDMIGLVYSVAEYLFQVETQIIGILEITQKRCSSTQEISAFNALHDCQGYSDLACHFHSGKLLHLPHVGKPSAHPLNDTDAIGLPWLGCQKKYDIIVNMCRYL